MSDIGANDWQTTEPYFSAAAGLKHASNSPRNLSWGGGWRTRVADPDPHNPHSFWELDPDTHLHKKEKLDPDHDQSLSEKLDPDPH